jgi:hypothetical protein
MFVSVHSGLRPCMVDVFCAVYGLELRDRPHTAHNLPSLHGATARSGPGLPQSQTLHTRKDSSGRAMSPKESPPPDSRQYAQNTNIHGPGGIRARNHNKRMAADLRLGPHGHWDGHQHRIHQGILWLKTSEAQTLRNDHYFPTRH